AALPGGSEEEVRSDKRQVRDSLAASYLFLLPCYLGLMALNTCPRCQRANPVRALYCHHDGMALRVPEGGQGIGSLPHEFVFSSGRRCRTYDELVQGCHYEWEDARVMLRKGVFAQYMTSIGRMDLARAAQEAQTNPDPD